ncbi:MAG: 50S ribosomal protein L10 [Acidilobaceae archaeon]
MSLKVRTRKVQPWKVQVVEELKKLMTSYRTILLADLTGTPTNVVQKIRKELRKVGETKVAKKSLILKAVESLNIDKSSIENVLQGTVLLIFSNENPFKLFSLVDSIKVAVDAKPGQVAPKDIIVPEGPTNIPAGPMLGVLGRLKIPYEVRGGKAYIKKSTVVVKAGQIITPEVASVLQKIGIKPIETSLKVIAAYEGGLVLPVDSLKLDLESFSKELSEAVQELLKVAVEGALFDVEEAVPHMLLQAERRANVLAEELAIPLPGLLEPALRKAVAECFAIVLALGEKAKELGIEEAVSLSTVHTSHQLAQASAPTTQQTEEKKEEKKEEEVDLYSGLSGLFGI